jgi:hypothetical protein
VNEATTTMNDSGVGHELAANVQTHEETRALNKRGQRRRGRRPRAVVDHARADAPQPNLPASRVSSLSDTDVLALIPGYHPIYAEVDPELLVLINDQATNGWRRSWAAFTHGPREQRRQIQSVASRAFTLGRQW